MQHTGFARALMFAAVLQLLLAGGTRLPQTAGVDALATLMSGTFNTFDQGAADERVGTTYKHLGVVLHVSPPLTLTLPGGGTTFYVEQALAKTLDKPYRQRVDRLLVKDGSPVVAIWRIADATPFVGAWKDVSRASMIPAASLRHDTGCDVYMTPTADGWTGATRALECGSTTQGATWMRSEVSFTRAGMVTLDRGYDAGGGQKWGPTDGLGYRFMTTAEPP